MDVLFAIFDLFSGFALGGFARAGGRGEGGSNTASGPIGTASGPIGTASGPIGAASGPIG